MMLETAEHWTNAAREMIRAIRGKRSQVAFSRRLGYRSNVVADWEGGHRAPTAVILFEAMARSGIDVQQGFEDFHAGSAASMAQGIDAWLESLRGHTSQAELARRSGHSRHQVRRWLSGEACPRVPQFLHLVHALTGRSHDWVAAFVDIRQIPSLQAQHRAAHTAARLAYDHPWSAAVRMLITSDAYQSDPTDAFLRRSLGISPEALEAAVVALLEAGLAVRVGGRLRSLATFTSQAMASDEDRRRLKAHWTLVAAERLNHPRAADLVSLNLVALSRADLARVRQLQRDYFRELRSLVAASEPEEVAALVLMHVISLAPDEDTDVSSNL